MQIPIFREGGCMKKLKLGEICEIQAGGTPSRNKKEFWVQGNIPWVKIKDINSKYISKVEEHITELGLQFSSAKLFSRGTILYTIFATIGEVAILDIDAATNQAIAGLHLKSEKVLKEYLYFFLLSIKNRVKNDSRGVAQNNINLTYLKNIEVPIVENSIQQEICNNLTKINQIITLRNQQLIELSNLVKSRFNEMFGDIFDTTFPIYRLEELCEFIKDGTHQTPQYTDDRTNGFKFLSSKDVTSGKISWENIKYITESLHNELYSKISPRRNDILLAKNGTTGIAALVDCDEIFDIYVSLAILRFYDGNNPTYLLYAINSDATKWQFESKLKGVGVPNLHLREIRKTKIPLPPLSLQNEFADFVAQVDKSQFACQIVIKLWRNSLKSSII